VVRLAARVEAAEGLPALLEEQLGAWEATRDREATLKADLKTAKDATAAAVKAVGKTLKEIKALRKSAKAAPAEKKAPQPAAKKSVKKAPKPPVQG